MSKYKKRADGRYCKQVFLGFGKDGKRILKSVYGKTIKEVEEKERDILNQIQNGLNVAEKPKVKDWANIWLKEYKRDVEHNTYVMYENSVKKHIIPSLGDIYLSDLKPIHIQSVLNRLIDNDVNRTAEIFRLTMNQVIAQACENGYMKRNIMSGVSKVSYKPEEKRILTTTEELSIEKSMLTDKQKVFIYLLKYTGIRRGEALALSKNDFDLKKHSLRITKSIAFKDNGQCVVKSPKTAASIRTIPLPNILTSLLSDYFGVLDGDILFPMQNGCYMTASSFRRFWDSISNRVSEQMGEKVTFTPHTFRHTYATMLYYAGIDVKRAQQYLGHTNLSVTLEIYTHLINGETSLELDKINSHLDKKIVTQNAL